MVRFSGELGICRIPFEVQDFSDEKRQPIQESEMV